MTAGKSHRLTGRDVDRGVGQSSVADLGLRYRCQETQSTCDDQPCQRASPACVPYR
jgi:hypothetical protein